MLARDSRNLKKLKAALRARYALRQRIERIDWEFDEFLPEVEKFLSQAKLPEPPELNVVDIVWDDNDKDKTE